MVKFDQMWFIFQHSLPCGPHVTLLPSDVAALGYLWCRNTHPDPQNKVLNCRYDLIIGPILLLSQVFLYIGEQKIAGVKSGEYGGWSTSSKPQSRTAAIATTDLCAGALSWWNRTPFVSFPGHFEMSLLLLFKMRMCLCVCVCMNATKKVLNKVCQIKDYEKTTVFWVCVTACVYEFVVMGGGGVVHTQICVGYSLEC